MKRIGGFGLGHCAEGVLESSNKVLRVIINRHSRNTSVKDRMTDCLNHLWLKTHPLSRKLKDPNWNKPKSATKKKASEKTPYDIIVDKFLVQSMIDSD